MGAVQHVVGVYLLRIWNRDSCSGESEYQLVLKGAAYDDAAQGEAFRAIKAASPRAQVGSAYGVAPGYPKTDSEADKAATARYHAMNNVFQLHAAYYGEYPKAFVGEPPYEQMGFKAGDGAIMKVPLDWVGLHYYTRRIVSDAGGAKGAACTMERRSKRTREIRTGAIHTRASTR